MHGHKDLGGFYDKIMKIKIQQKSIQRLIYSSVLVIIICAGIFPEMLGEFSVFLRVLMGIAGAFCILYFTEELIGWH